MRPTPRRDPGEERRAERHEGEGSTGAPPRKQIYLRTVYALNPGIPHYVDVPGGWE